MYLPKMKCPGRREGVMYLPEMECPGSRKGVMYLNVLGRGKGLCIYLK